MVGVCAQSLNQVWCGFCRPSVIVFVHIVIVAPIGAACVRALAAEARLRSNWRPPGSPTTEAKLVAQVRLLVVRLGAPLRRRGGGALAGLGEMWGLLHEDVGPPRPLLLARRLELNQRPGLARGEGLELGDRCQATTRPIERCPSGAGAAGKWRRTGAQRTRPIEQRTSGAEAARECRRNGAQRRSGGARSALKRRWIYPSEDPKAVQASQRAICRPCRRKSVDCCPALAR